MIKISSFLQKALFFCLMVSIGMGILYLNSSKFIARDVYLQDIPMEGLTREEAETKVSKHIDLLEKKIIIIVDETGDQTYTFSPKDLGINFSVEKTLTALFNSGHSIWLKAQVMQPFEEGETKRVQPVIELEEDRITHVLKESLSKKESPAVNSMVVWNPESGWEVQKELWGRQVKEGELSRLHDTILNDIYGDYNQEYHVDYLSVSPQVFSEELNPMKEELTLLSEFPVKINFGKIEKVIDLPEEASKWFQVSYQTKEVSINESVLNAYVDDFIEKNTTAAGQVTVKSIQEYDSEYVREKYKKAQIEGQFSFGVEWNREQMIQALKKALMDESIGEIIIEPSITPPVIKSELEGYTFPEFISRGESDYSHGNHDNRIHNIKTAMDYQDLTVIDPGETFSYNKILGWVTHEKGYVDGEVIFGSGVGMAPGGGVCQTSTTMFRAALNAGLPIVKRKNHSWDVVYYRDEYGLDAAVYPPGEVDLMFTNDTLGPILVHSYINEETENAYFDFYGTSDGRQVTIDMTANYRWGTGRIVKNDWQITWPDGIIEKREVVSNYSK